MLVKTQKCNKTILKPQIDKNRVEFSKSIANFTELSEQSTRCYIEQYDQVIQTQS